MLKRDRSAGRSRWCMGAYVLEKERLRCDVLVVLCGETRIMKLRSTMKSQLGQDSWPGTDTWVQAAVRTAVR